MPLPHSAAAAVITCNDGSRYTYDSNTSAAGLQVAEYMEEMQEDSEENYNKHFSQYMAAEVEGGDLEELMAKVMLHVI